MAISSLSERMSPRFLPADVSAISLSSTYLMPSTFLRVVAASSWAEVL